MADKCEHEPGDHDRLDKPVCSVCAFGIEAVEEHEKEMMKDLGWYAHYVHDDPNTPFNINYHTHGLSQSFKHKDLQACLPIDFKVLHTIVTSIVNEIKAGKTFAAGDPVFNILQGDYAITFMDAKECGRDVLRVIFPDPTGHLKKDEIEKPYDSQWD